MVLCQDSVLHVACVSLICSLREVDLNTLFFVLFFFKTCCGDMLNMCFASPASSSMWWAGGMSFKFVGSRPPNPPCEQESYQDVCSMLSVVW